MERRGQVQMKKLEMLYEGKAKKFLKPMWKMFNR